jgi:hypothetical protein
MSKQVPGPLKSRVWGEFRLSVVGGLLASPPKKGELRAALQELSQKQWRHPENGEPVQYSFATVEEWFYLARKHPDDPVSALSNGRRRDRGHGRNLSEAFKAELMAQYRRFPDWTVKLHFDNLRTLVDQRSDLGPAPSYATVLRYMRQNGLERKRKIRRRRTPGLELAETRLEKKKLEALRLSMSVPCFILIFMRRVGKFRMKKATGSMCTVWPFMMIIADWLAMRNGIP